MGDLNYRIFNIDNLASIIIEEMIENNFDKNTLKKYYENYDELYLQMKKENIYSFQEGINNEGPMFQPTCKLSKTRNKNCQETDNPDYKPTTDCWKIGNQSQRIPSWCDRILYKKTNQYDPRDLYCIEYDVFDYNETMTKSDHKAVYGIYELVNKQKF